MPPEQPRTGDHESVIGSDAQISSVQRRRWLGAALVRSRKADRRTLGVQLGVRSSLLHGQLSIAAGAGSRRRIGICKVAVDGGLNRGLLQGGGDLRQLWLIGNTVRGQGIDG